MISENFPFFLVLKKAKCAEKIITDWYGTLLT
jgi:hypothetical protein